MNEEEWKIRVDVARRIEEALHPSIILAIMTIHQAEILGSAKKDELLTLQLKMGQDPGSPVRYFFEKLATGESIIGDHELILGSPLQMIEAIMAEAIKCD